jgi:hypothetical protein
MIFTQTALIFSKGEVQYPVKAALNRPVSANGVEGFQGRAVAGGDEVAGAHGDFLVERVLSPHLDQRGEVWPLAARAQCCVQGSCLPSSAGSTARTGSSPDGERGARRCRGWEYRWAGRETSQTTSA